jgi:hypothetical protein
MLTFRQFNESAPSEQMKQQHFFHGTTSREAALGIAKHGLKPKEPPKKAGHLTPVKGKVYVTPHLHYAQIYAQGGDIAGSDHKMKHHEKDPHGYVFKFHGSKLKDVQPDEDSVGEHIYHKKHEWLNNMAKAHLNPSTHRKVMNGEYSSWASAGKQLIRKMSDHQKHEVIKHGAHVAHEGDLHPDEVYRIHHSKIKHLKPDGSNFHDHAEKIGLHEI